jgi:phosphinothricin acetyltransferase
MIRPVNIADANTITFIYNYYIKNSPVTFEEVPLGIHDMTARIRDISARFPWFVWEEEGEILGYAYIHQYHERMAYRYTAEDSIYIKEGSEGKGIGRALLEKLIDSGRSMKLHALISVITIPNPASVSLHEKFGFEKIAHFREVGFKFNQWLDVGYWELLLAEAVV